MILTALFLLAAGDLPEVKVERLAAGRYRLTATLPGEVDPEAGRRALLPAATRLCGGEPVSFGHFTWDGEERLDKDLQARKPVSLTLRQEVACAAPPAPAPVTAAAPDAAWRANPVDEQAVREATARYLAAKDQGRYDDAWALLTPSMRTMTSQGRQQDGGWQVTREEQNVLASDDAPKAGPEEVARLRAQLGCRD
jgi:hypothetical protein